VDLHLILPYDMRLDAAHDQVVAMEALLQTSLGPEADIMIHADPCHEGHCSACDVEGCWGRRAPATVAPIWLPETTGNPSQGS